MEEYTKLKKKWLKDKDIKREYDLLGPEYDALKKIIELRLKSKITQKELAEKVGTKQSSISRFEKGFINPTVNFLSKVSSALGKKMVIEFR